MAQYRVKEGFSYIGGDGNEKDAIPGELIEIQDDDTAHQLEFRGYVSTLGKSDDEGKPLLRQAATQRIGMWIRTSRYYSGGRIMMYQFALNLSDAGADVFYISNRVPPWNTDYHHPENITFLSETKDPIPSDLDVMITDGKALQGQKAKEWCDHHERTKLVSVCFETPNWVKEYCPGYGERLENDDWSEAFESSDLLIGITDLALQKCKGWVDEHPSRTGVVHPVVNTDALRKAGDGMDIGRPYAVWSARGANYKGGHDAIEAIWGLDRPFDIVGFGSPPDVESTDKHQIHDFSNYSDERKFTALKGAEVTLTPSKFEGFGMVPAESLASGTPVVAYELPVLRETYGDKLVYADWDDQEDFAEKTKDIIEDEVDVDRSWALNKFDLGSMKDEIEDMPYLSVNTPSVTAHMICYATPTATYALRSVYPYVDQIRIAYGPTQRWVDYPEGGVLEQINHFDDPEDKIEMKVKRVWPNKREMRQWATKDSIGNYQLMLDADEIWENPQALFESDAKWGCPRWVNYWHDLDHWVYDSDGREGNRWGTKVGDKGSVHQHYRYSWWRSTYTWKYHMWPQTYAKDSIYFDNEEVAKQVPEACIHHLGHALPEDLMRKKHEFYEARDGSDREFRREAWHSWDGTTGDCGDGIVEKVSWDVPELVKNAYKGINNNE